MSDHTSWSIRQDGTSSIRPDDAAGALAEVEQRHRQIVDLMDIPRWYSSVIAVLMVVLTVAIDTHQRTALAVAIPLFVIGVLLSTGTIVGAGAKPGRVRT
jgi:hypothetical protein